MTIPVQEFQIGQRVRPTNDEPAFVIVGVCLGPGSWSLRYSDAGRRSYWSKDLIPAPERKPYEPTERLVLSRELGQPFSGRYPQDYRCETDAEMAARHAIERAEYDHHPEFDEVVP